MAEIACLPPMPAHWQFGPSTTSISIEERRGEKKAENIYLNIYIFNIYIYEI